MMELSATGFGYFSLALQVAAVASVICTRLWESYPVGAALRPACFAILIAAALMGIWAVADGNGCWRTCGLTLAVMAVAVTLDLRSGQRISAF